jgi:gamma-glutamyltranspeptidase/glutathione hydrolase
VNGVVAGGSQQTVDAGAAMLRQGGNAVDAAVAAAFASFVAEGAISAPGGGGFALVCGADRTPILYDFFVAAPGKGRGGTLRPDLDFASVPIVFEDVTEHYHVGRGSTCVPGNIAGLIHLLEEAGTLPLRTVLEPTIKLAREGFILSEMQGYMIQLLGGIMQYTPENAAIFAPEGRLLRQGERFANPALADTLEHIAEAGWQTLYTGPLAEALLAEHEAHGGLLTGQDLADYRVIKREPLALAYRGNTLYTTPPPSLGGILIAYALGVLSNADMKPLHHGSAAHIALLAEVMRAADIARHRDQPSQLTDRTAWEAWLHPDRLRTAWQQVVTHLSAGPPACSPEGPGGPSNTTHISVMDENGLSVGLTTTPGETAGYVVGNTGLLMNNILGEKDLNPDGFHRWPAGHRLSSMMAPTIIVDADGPRMVIGSGGSNRLRSAILQAISNVLDWRLRVDEAANRSRVHFERDLLDLEAGFNPVAADMLAARGYRLTRWTEKSLYFGGAHLALRDAAGRLTGAGDRRRGGAVAVVE